MFLHARQLKFKSARTQEIKKHLIFFLVLFLGLGRALPVYAEAPGLEYQVKAAFLFNFAKFVEWPPKSFSDQTSHVVIGILGENPFGDILTTAAQGQRLNGRAIVIKHSSSLEDLKNCHLLFISRSEQKSQQEILDLLHASSILTVSDNENFAKEGGMIQFIKKENKIRFQINRDAAKAANLKISSKLLSLADSA